MHKRILDGCYYINIKTILTNDEGELSVFEDNHDISFKIRRIYYITKAPKATKRGFHAHKTLKQLLVCPYGEIKLTLDDGVKKESVVLNDPSVGIVIDRIIWRDMEWLQDNSVLFVAASDYYKPEDYIRDYDEFLRFSKKSSNI